jgi:hypothetical protein
MSNRTRRSRRWRGLSACLLIAACGESTGPEPVTPLTRSSDHFVFESNTARATTAEMDAGIQQAEDHYAAIAALIGANRVPAGKITVILEGDKTPDRTGGYVDEDGAVRISRYRQDLGGYFGVLAHEIAHALRYTYWHRFNVGPWENFGYIEEGFAEYVAIAVHPDKPGFPFYGYPPDVITGQRLIRGEGIPQQVMREGHDLNTPCEWQTYPLRASWFLYVDETYGRQAVLGIAFSTVETTTEMIENLLGDPIEVVDASWEQWQRARYAAIPGAAQIAAPYFEKFEDVPICVEGEDW